MARRITIVQGHPDASQPHLCHALADAYGDAAAGVGCEVRYIDVARRGFPLLRSQDDFEKGAIPAVLNDDVAALEWCDHMLIVFPLWLGTMPAMLKGFFEQVARPGRAFEYVEHGLPRKLWKGKSACIVVTMGMPSLVYRWWFGAHGLRVLESNILNFVGVSPIRENLFGGIGAASEAKRAKWLEEMRKRGTAGD